MQDSSSDNASSKNQFYLNKTNSKDSTILDGVYERVYFLYLYGASVNDIESTINPI